LLLVALIRAHLHISEVEGLLVSLVVVRRIGFILEGSGRGLTRIMALQLLLVVLVLSDQVLVPRSVIIVREELGQQQVHVGALLPAVVLQLPIISTILVLLSLLACLVVVILLVVVVPQIEAVGVLGMAELHRAAFLADKVIRSRVLVRLQTIIAH